MIVSTNNPGYQAEHILANSQKRHNGVTVEASPRIIKNKLKITKNRNTKTSQFLMVNNQRVTFFAVMKMLF